MIDINKDSITGTYTKLAKYVGIKNWLSILFFLDEWIGNKT